MNSKILSVFFLFIIIISISLSLQATPFSSRPDGARLSRVIDRFYVCDITAVNGTTDFITDYVYSSAEQMLVDSITVTTLYNNEPGSVTHYRYLHSLEQINNQTVKQYYEYKMPENILNKHYKFVTDESNNPIETLIIKADTPVLHIDFHYNSSGLADSIYYLRNSESTDFFSYYKMVYDENNRLSYSLYYQCHNNIWVPQRKIIQHFGQFPELYTTPLDFANYMQHSLKDDLEDFTAKLDRFWLPDSISSADWNGDKWVPCTHNSYTVVGSVDGVHMNINDAHMATVSNYSFNPQGILTEFTSNWSADLIRTYRPIWENPVPNEDEYQFTPSALLSVSAYPNPFKSNLSIRFTGNDKSSAEISIYNIKGQLIRSWKNLKSNELSWDGKDNASQSVSSGMYLIRAKQGKNISTAKIVKY